MWKTSYTNCFSRSMLGVVLVVVMLVFYLSHRSMRKRNEDCPQRRWQESDASLEVYTVDQVSIIIYHNFSYSSISLNSFSTLLREPPTLRLTIETTKCQTFVPFNRLLPTNPLWPLAHPHLSPEPTIHQTPTN